MATQKRECPTALRFGSCRMSDAPSRAAVAGATTSLFLPVDRGVSADDLADVALLPANLLGLNWWKAPAWQPKSPLKLCRLSGDDLRRIVLSFMAENARRKLRG